MTAAVECLPGSWRFGEHPTELYEVTDGRVASNWRYSAPRISLDVDVYAMVIVAQLIKALDDNPRFIDPTEIAPTARKTFSRAT